MIAEKKFSGEITQLNNSTKKTAFVLVFGLKYSKALAICNFGVYKKAYFFPAETQLFFFSGLVDKIAQFIKINGNFLFVIV